MQSPHAQFYDWLMVRQQGGVTGVNINPPTPVSLGASRTSSVVDEEEKVLFHLPAVCYAAS